MRSMSLGRIMGGRAGRWLSAAAGLALAAGLAGDALAQTTLRVFVGGNARPDLVRKLLDGFEAQNPGVKAEVEVGGATSEQQSKYLNTVLTSKDSALDLFLVDIVRTTQNQAAGWTEPLDKYLGADKDKVMGQYLAPYREANVFNGQVIALPFFADAQFLYYRKDLLDKYNLKPAATWDELAAQWKTVNAGENNPNLQGFSTAGAPIEGTVCTYLVPLWAKGGNLTTGGKLSLDGAPSTAAFEVFSKYKAEGVLPGNIAEVVTDRIRKDMQAGNVLYSMLWVYAYNLFQTGEDSAVKGKIGVARLPGFAAGDQPTCIGGWQIAVSAFSKNKDAAAKLAIYLASRESSKTLAIDGQLLPVYSELYKDPDVLAKNPWFDAALPVLLAARARPVTPRYGEVSEVIRTNMNAFLAGTKSADDALKDMKTKLGGVFR
ncbi:MAG: ABC transporter substrate-binding protein [Alsobacter sp.]